jgi:hypothetical protein
MEPDDDLNKIKLPLAELRLQIVAMMREGETEVSLGDYLHMLQAIYRKKKEDESSN